MSIESDKTKLIIIESMYLKLVQDNKKFLNNKLFLEFGVFEGRSLSQFHKLYEDLDITSQFYGFDSWRGLPEEIVDKNSPWSKGDFDSRGKKPIDQLHCHAGKDKDNIHFVDGYFDESLTDELGKKFSKQKAGIVHIDCDTYSSTKTVHQWLTENKLLRKGSLVVYDDWGGYIQAQVPEYTMGESMAHKEWCEEYNLQFEEVGEYVADPEYYIIKVFRYLG